MHIYIYTYRYEQDLDKRECIVSHATVYKVYFASYVLFQNILIKNYVFFSCIIFKYLIKNVNLQVMVERIIRKHHQGSKFGKLSSDLLPQNEQHSIVKSTSKQSSSV